MRISIKCKCGRKLKTSIIYDSVICLDCGAENEIEKDNKCSGCKDYFRSVAGGWCLNKLKTDCRIMRKIRESNHATNNGKISG